MNPTEIATEANGWIVGGDTGLSSCAIWGHMMGADPSKGSRFGAAYPLDPDDFGRCYRLLKLIPAWRDRLGEMARYGPEWAALAAAWDELTALYEEEVDCSGPRHRGSAPKLYARMKKIERGAAA